MGMQLTHSPQALPGCCRLCGSSSKLPLLDINYSEEFHGAIYYCKECTFNMASLFGFITPEVADTLKVTIEDLVIQNEQLINKVRELEGAIRGMVNSGSFTSADNSDSITEPIVLETPTEPENGSQGDSDQLGDGEGTFVESSDEQGLADVYSGEQSDEYSDGGISI